MAKLGLRQVLGSILVWVLFAPVILASATFGETDGQGDSQ